MVFLLCGNTIAVTAAFLESESRHLPCETSYPKKMTFLTPMKDFFIFRMTPNSSQRLRTRSSLEAASS